MAALATVAVGVALPLSLLAPVLGFVAPPPVFFGALVVLVVTYLVLIELAKHLFFGAGVPHPTSQRGGCADTAAASSGPAARFSVTSPLTTQGRRR